MKDYNHQAIEKKWQAEWAKKKAYKAENNSKKKKQYVLDMFPYPSGAGLHVGHPKGYIGSDVYARMKRMQGFNVLHPMGYDAFGLPAEQYALEHKISPKKAVAENVKTFEKQLSIIGLSYDWERRVNTTDPEFYKWTQWIFLKMYESWYDKKANKARPVSELVKIFEKSGNATVDAATSETVEFSAVEWKTKNEKEKQDVLMKYRLAYEGSAQVNWCPELGTVLANDEIVDGPDGKPVSERGGFPVEKKEMRQWFMRITAYADRLLTGLEGLNWSDHIKEIERNWIGKSEGTEVNFTIISPDKKGQPLKASSGRMTIKVFTTRPDTLFGVTYVVLSPEHQILSDLKSSISNWSEVEKYVAEAKSKLTTNNPEEKEKTGVELKGVKAINPANSEEVPVWVADYVLASYGTGAVMAVPAHDERDWEFAKKYGLPIKNVVQPLVTRQVGDDAFRDDEPISERRAVVAVIKHWSEDKYLGVEWKKTHWKGFVIGGIEENEDAIIAGMREISEETGYKNIKFTRELGDTIHARFYQQIKKQNRVAHFSPVLFQLLDGEMIETSEEEKNLHEFKWLTPSEFSNFITHYDMQIVWNRVGSNNCYTFDGEVLSGGKNTGVLSNSGKFDGMDSEEAKKEIVKFVRGKVVTKYKMRDAIFARQRYWGEPIPLMTDKSGLIHEVPEKQLPLKLPEVKSYKPTGTGESPLASVPAWTKKGYETNTMPGWAGSSWYFLRYMDPRNKKAFADKKAIKYWKNVDMYVGGAEHATGHLLYARFWHKFLKDLGLVQTEEPFQTLKNQGMILGTDNRKMSKRWGNVINPDEIVKTFGADTLRVYEMFMGPFEGTLPWSTDNLVGSRRFVERVWRVVGKVSLGKTSVKKVSKVTLAGVELSKRHFDTDDYRKFEMILHKTIQKVGNDIESFAFNTAVSAMMIVLNELEKLPFVRKSDFEMFLKILSPFAPHVAEEMWHELDHKTLIVSEPWPKFNVNKMKESQVRIVIQVNSRVRAEILVAPDTAEADVVAVAKSLPAVDKWLTSLEIKKIIYIRDKLLNIVAQ